MRAFSDAVRTAGVRGAPWAQEWVNAAAGQAAERLVGHGPVLGGELPGVLDVIGDQGRRDGQAELGGRLELGWLEVGGERAWVVDVADAVRVVCCRAK